MLYKKITSVPWHTLSNVASVTAKKIICAQWWSKKQWWSSDCQFELGALETILAAFNAKAINGPLNKKIGIGDIGSKETAPKLKLLPSIPLHMIRVNKTQGKDRVASQHLGMRRAMGKSERHPEAAVCCCQACTPLASPKGETVTSKPGHSAWLYSS